MEMEDDNDMAMEVMKGILGHAKQMRAKGLHDKYAPKEEPKPEAEVMEIAEDPEGVSVTQVETEGKPELSEEQIAQLIEMLKAK